MKKIFLILLLLALSCFASQIEIVSTTSHLSLLAKEIGGKSVNVTTMIPPGICPGHYELKPNDIKRLHNGGILLHHGWEGFVEDVSKTVSKSDAKLFKIDVHGNWLVPETQIKAAEKICAILKELDLENSNFYEKNLDSYIKRMHLLDKRVKQYISENKLAGIKIVCAGMQKNFIDHLGLEVIDTFGRDEDTGPVTISSLISKIISNDVKIIVSNLQSGTSIGKMLSKNTGVPHAILSNFPGGLKNTKTIEDTVMKNLSLLKDAINNQK